MRHHRPAALLISLLVAAPGCLPDQRRSERNPLEQPPVDSLAVQGIAGWKYREEMAPDLDGDGIPEQLVLAADVELGNGDLPLWKDGHGWGLFVQSSGGARTMLYAAFVPDGRPEAAVLQVGKRGRRRVLVQERTPSQLRVFEVEYEGPGKARLSSAAYSQVERWLAPPP